METSTGVRLVHLGVLAALFGPLLSGMVVWAFVRSFVGHALGVVGRAWVNK